MKKLVFFFILMFLAVNAHAAQKYIFEKFEHHKEIKVFLKNVTNEAANPMAKADLFEAGFKKALKSRREIKFIPVDSESEADVVVTAEIKDFAFTKEAMPVPVSAIALAADIAEPKCSAKLTVSYEIIDPKSGEMLGRYNDFVTYYRCPRKGITEEVSYEHAVNDNSKKFIVKAFYRPN